MKKRMIITIAVLLCVLLFVVGVPVIINECYKIGGYITLWDAADVLAYYGIILGAVVSIGVLAATIYYNRHQLVAESKRQAEVRKWQTIEQSTNEALDTINPYVLMDITSKSIGQSDAMLYGRISMYQINATKAVDKFRLITDTEDCSLMKNLSNELQRVAQRCIDLQKEYTKEFESLLQDRLGAKYMQECGSAPEMIQKYNLGIFQKSMERTKELTSNIKKVYKEDYCPLISQKAKTFSEIYRQIAENGTGGTDNADTGMDRKR